VKLWVVAEHRGWRPANYCEAAVWLITESLAKAEAFAQTRVDAPFDDDEIPDSWFIDLTEMTVGVPLTAHEERIVINRRGERASHPTSLNTDL
jgi:hypothetical protein